MDKLMYTSYRYSRRDFIWIANVLMGKMLLAPRSLLAARYRKPVLSAHVWVYASRFSPNWDCTPILDQVFRDLMTAGFQGVELMEVNLRHDDAVDRIGEYIAQYALPVTGASYYGDMWDKTQHQRILEDVEMVIERLAKLKAARIGLTVGDAGRKKTGTELDVQAEMLERTMKICKHHQIEPVLHNHTFELADGLYDIVGTMERVPELKLGPDINWLIRGGVDPIRFIHQYGHKIVYLHLRDQDDGGKWTAIVGDGVTDFLGIANALRQVDFRGDAAIELAFDETPVEPIEQCWQRSREYVSRVFEW